MIVRKDKPFITKVIRSRRRQNSITSASSEAAPFNHNGVLALIRHGESEYNKQDRFTGLKNPSLTAHGIREAIDAGRTLKATGFHCDVAFTSKLRRAQQSLQLIVKELQAKSAPRFEEAALNERDYGELAGLTREAARARWGAARVQAWRRSFDIAPPGGESLQMTAGRTLPFFDHHIRPLLVTGQRVLVVAHGNSLRSIVMSLEELTPDQIVNVSFATGTLLLYKMDSFGAIVARTEIPVTTGKNH